MQTTLNQHEIRLNSSWQVVLSGSILEVQAKGFGSGALFLSKGRKVSFSNICLQMFKALIEANQIFWDLYWNKMSTVGVCLEFLRSREKKHACHMPCRNGGWPTNHKSCGHSRHPMLLLLQYVSFIIQWYPMNHNDGIIDSASIWSICMGSTSFKHLREEQGLKSRCVSSNHSSKTDSDLVRWTDLPLGCNWKSGSRMVKSTTRGTEISWQ